MYAGAQASSLLVSHSSLSWTGSLDILLLVRTLRWNTMDTRKASWHGIGPFAGLRPLYGTEPLNIAHFLSVLLGELCIV